MVIFTNSVHARGSLQRSGRLSWSPETGFFFLTPDRTCHPHNFFVFGCSRLLPITPSYHLVSVDSFTPVANDLEPAEHLAN
jgi:hypothetical protein